MKPGTLRSGKWIALALVGVTNNVSQKPDFSAALQAQQSQPRFIGCCIPFGIRRYMFPSFDTANTLMDFRYINSSAFVLSL